MNRPHELKPSHQRDIVVIPGGNVTAPVLPPTPREKEGKSFGVAVENIDTALAIYPDEQRAILEFWYYLAKDKSWTLKEMERQTAVSSSSLTRVFRGIYGADAGKIIERLEKAKEGLIHAADNPEFIMTSLAKLMFTAFDKNRAMKNVVIMWGPKGIGKTVIEKEYTRQNNHGKTFYVRCPGSGCTVFQFIHHIADSMHLTVSRKGMFEVRKEIVKYLSKGQRLLIVDELHEIFLTCADRTIVQICEFLRELADLSDCGLSLTGTDDLYHHFFNGEHKNVLAQLVDRGTVQIELPETHTKQDVLAFLDHFGLSMPAEDHSAFGILNDIIKEAGLRKLAHHLRDGKAFSGKKGEDYTWDHFTAAFVAIKSLSKRRKRS